MNESMPAGYSQRSKECRKQGRVSEDNPVSFCPFHLNAVKGNSGCRDCHADNDALAGVKNYRHLSRSNVSAEENTVAGDILASDNRGSRTDTGRGVRYD